jgi:hypothetical protein
VTGITYLESAETWRPPRKGARHKDTKTRSYTQPVNASVFSS